MADRSNDNWDNLLSELGHQPSPSESAEESPIEAARTTEPERLPETAATAGVEADEALPTEYPTAKPSGWDALLGNLGIEDSAPAPAPKSAPAPAPEAVSEPVSDLLEQDDTDVDEEEIVNEQSEPESADAAFGDFEAAEAASIDEKRRPESNEISFDPPAPTEPVAEAPPAKKKPTGGFSGWFPFAARRAKPDPPQEAEEAAELPADLFSAPAEPESDANEESSASESYTSNGDERDSEEAEDRPPRRRRRRGGRRRRKKPEGEAAETQSVESDLEDAVEEGTLNEETEADEGAAEESDGERRGRRRRRRGGRGRGRGRDRESVDREDDADSDAEADADADADEQLLDGQEDQAPEEDADREQAKPASHKNITPWREAIGAIVDANIAAREERRRSPGGGGRGGSSRGGSGRGGRSRGGRRRRSSSRAEGEASSEGR